MKRLTFNFFLTMFIIICAVVSIRAENCCVDYDRDCCFELEATYEKYYEMKAKAKECGTLDCKLGFMSEAVELTENLKRSDLTAWAFFNMAIYSITAYWSSQSEIDLDKAVLYITRAERSASNLSEAQKNLKSSEGLNEKIFKNKKIILREYNK